MTSQCREYYDIIVDPLINKEFLIKKFFLQFVPISFCLSDRNTYNPKIHRSFLFSLLFNPTFSSRFLPCPKIQDPQRKLTFAIPVKLRIGTEKEKKQHDVKKRLTNFVDF